MAYGDTISRQAAIDAAKDWYDGLICGSFKGLKKCLEALPSAQPEPPEECERCMMEHTDEMEKLEAELAMAQPKRGRWIYCEDSTANCVDGYRCDQCGLFVPWDYQHKSIDYIKDYNFCPHCGAKMEVTE